MCVFIAMVMQTTLMGQLMFFLTLAHLNVNYCFLPYYKRMMQVDIT